MNKKDLKMLAEIAKKRLKSERQVIDLVRWASIKENRSKQMSNYLNDNPDATEAQIRYEMCKIVANEQF